MSTNEKFHYYYLHTNGSIIGKPPGVVDITGAATYFDSDFVRKVWHVNLSNRADAWILVLEALALGANIERGKELCDKWKLTPDDLRIFMTKVKPSVILKQGMDRYFKEFYQITADEWLDMEIDDNLKKLKEIADEH